MAAGKRAGYAAAVTVILLSAASTVQGQVVSFTEIRDAVPQTFFNAANTAANPVDGNNLIIGFESGFDRATFLNRDFRASTLPFFRRNAMDTIRFMIQAPAGYYVSKITYTQAGNGSAARGAVQGGAAEWEVAGFPSSLGVFGGNPNLSGSADLSTLKLTSVPVSITLSLFSAAAGSVAVTSADVQVEVLPLVEPQAPVELPLTAVPELPVIDPALAIDPLPLVQPASPTEPTPVVQPAPLVQPAPVTEPATVIQPALVAQGPLG